MSNKENKFWSISTESIKNINGIKEFFISKQQKNYEFSSHKFNLIYGSNGVGKSSFFNILSSSFSRTNSNKKIKNYKYLENLDVENIKNKTKLEKEADYTKEKNVSVIFQIKDSLGEEKKITPIKKELKILLFFYTSDPYAISKTQLIYKKFLNTQTWTTRGWDNSFKLKKNYFKRLNSLFSFQETILKKKEISIDFNLGVFNSEKIKTKKERIIKINKFFNSVLLTFFKELKLFLKEMLKLSNISFDEKCFQKEKKFQEILQKFLEIKNKKEFWIISNLKIETKKEKDFYENLSEGEQNLLGLIIILYNVGASLIFDIPILLVLDEPLICLDFLRYQKILGFLKFLKTVDKNNNLNIILATHSERFLKAIFWNFKDQNNLFLMTKDEKKRQLLQKIESEKIFSGELHFFYDKIEKFHEETKQKLQVHYLILSSSFISETLKIVYKKTTKWEEYYEIRVDLTPIKLKMQEYKNFVDIFLLHSPSELYQEDKEIETILKRNEIKGDYQEILKLILTSNSLFSKKILGKKIPESEVNLTEIKDFYKKIISEQKEILKIIFNLNDFSEEELSIDHNLYYIALALSARMIIEFFLKGCNPTTIEISNHKKNWEKLIEESFFKEKIDFQELRIFREFQHFLDIHSHFFPIGENSPIKEYHQHSYKIFFKKYQNWLKNNEEKILKFL